MTALKKRQGERAHEAQPVAVVVRHSFAAPAGLVFDAWLDPAMLGGWMFHPSLRNEEIVRLAIDPRVGGAFSFLIRRDGNDVHYRGQYLEIDRPRRLVFTWAMAPDSPEPDTASRVVVEIVSRGKSCDLTLVQDLPARLAAHADFARNAWASEFGVLSRRLVSGA